MASDTITSWQIDGGKTETVIDFIFLGSKTTAAMKLRHWLLGRETIKNLDSILKTRDITLPANVHLDKATVFPIVMYGCESWTVKKVQCWKFYAFFTLWC